jgi:hypothetical protein
MDGGSPLRWGPAVCRVRGCRGGADPLTLSDPVWPCRAYTIITFSDLALYRLPRSVMIVYRRQCASDPAGMYRVGAGAYLGCVSDGAC